jgi:hypothetical protein
MVIGMVPMALGLGEGGEQNAPLGRAVIGGLAFATVATLIFVPVVFSIVHRNFGRGLQSGAPPAGAPPAGSPPGSSPPGRSAPGGSSARPSTPAQAPPDNSLAALAATGESHVI